MSAANEIAPPVELHHVWLSAFKTLYGDLPRLIVAGFFVAASTLPLAGAILLHIPWLAIIAGMLPAMTLTSCAVAVGQSFAGKPKLRVFLQPDLSLAATIWATVALGTVLLSSDLVALRVFGVVIIASEILVIPAVLGYRGARDTGTATSWRNALVVVALRPSAALATSSACCVLAFAALASLGVLAVVAIPAGLALAIASSRSVIFMNQPDAVLR